MSKDKKQQMLVPRLRFPEFRQVGAWVRGHCVDIAEVLQGYGFPERHQGSTKGLYPFYKVSDISAAFEQGEKYISQANNYIDEDVLSEIGAKPVPKGTTIFAKIGEAIRSNRRAITTRLSIVDNNVAGVKAIPGKATDEFLYYLWSNISLIDFAGGVVPAISKSAIETIPVPYTEIEDEQQKIADCLGSLDDLISAEGRKLAALREHKKGLMQQLFPREGETRPWLRFPEFRNAGEWKKKKLGCFCRIQTGKKDANEGGQSGAYPFFTCAERHIFSDSYSFDTEAILVAGNANVGKCTYYNGRFEAYQRTYVLTDFAEIDVSYLFAFLDARLQRDMMKQIQSSAMSYIRLPMLKEYLIVFPHDPAEQQRIADCLASLDALIAAQAAKLDALRTHKRGLMQGLFPSPEDVGT